MPDAFLCDAIRTPIGRYGGALASVRPDDLAAIPLAALIARNPGVDWAAVDDVVYGCANQAGEDNRNVGRMALLLAGLPDDGARHHGQPAVRVEPRRHRHRGARHQVRRAVADDRRRRREHVARAVRAGQGDRGVLARGEDRRHDHRLALRQSADEGALRHRLDARDRRERRGASSASRAPTRTPSRCAAQQRAAAAHRRRAPGRGNRAGDAAREEGRPGRRRAGRASARDDAGVAGEAQGRRPARRHGDRGQRVRRQRRRLRDDHRVGRRGDAARPDPAGAHRRGGGRGVAPRIMGFGAGAGDAEGAGAGRPRASATSTSSSSTRRSPRRRSRSPATSACPTTPRT